MNTLNSSKSISPQPHGEWTIMVYMDGDNNLEKYALWNLNNMEKVDMPSNVHITFMLDRSPNFSKLDGDWSDTRMGIVSHDLNPKTITSPMENVGELNMGNPDTLTSFINWSTEIAPAEHYALILWDHGDGVEGTCWDFSSNYDNLTISEIQRAIENSNVDKFDLIGFDACLMSDIDVAFGLKDVTDFLVMSQAEEPATGWNYSKWLSIFNYTSNPSTELLAKAVALTYGHFYRYPVTMSVIDTSKTDELLDSMENFAHDLLAQPTDVYDLIDAAKETKQFDKEYVDLYQLMNNFIAQDISPALSQDALDITNVLNEMVVYNAGGMPNANGISLYFPKEPMHDYTPDNFDWLNTTGWNEVYGDIWTII